MKKKERDELFNAIKLVVRTEVARAMLEHKTHDHVDGMPRCPKCGAETTFDSRAPYKRRPAEVTIKCVAPRCRYEITLVAESEE